MVRNTDEEEIREHGFEQFIRGHIENTHMAFNDKFFGAHQDVVKALSDALWKRQTSPEQHRYHFEARRTWDTLGNAPKVKVPTLILCGAGDDVNRGGSTPVGTARKLGEIGSRLRACAGAQCQAYDLLGWRWGAARASKNFCNAIRSVTFTLNRETG